MKVTSPMKMQLTDEQRELLSRRKTTNLTLAEFLEVSVLQVEIWIIEKGRETEFADRLKELRDRIQSLGTNPMMSDIGWIQAQTNKLSQEVMQQ